MVMNIENFLQDIINNAKSPESGIVSPYKLYTLTYRSDMGNIKNKIKNDFKGGTSIIGNDLHTYIVFSETAPTDNLGDYVLVFDIDSQTETLQ
jgi:hypothetical protein